MARRKNARTEEMIELTQDAYDTLKKELEYKQTVEREEIAAEIATARELGDLRENQAYSFAMDRKERNELRISELEDMLKRARVVQSSNSNTIVQIGKTVEITNLETKSKMKVTLVGAEETQSANPGEGKLSIDSPVGKAIYNAKVGEIVVVKLPTKEIEYKINKIV